MPFKKKTQKIVVASTNPGKLAELSAMLDLDVEWLSLADFPDIAEVVEDADTFAQNARRKALGYACATGLWTIADDSGLVVDALGGAPGVKSARFSGEKVEQRRLLDHRNMAKVLGMLKGIPPEKRTARFVCCLCLACPEKVLAETQGKLEGFIAEEEHGTNGFGYDPIFFVPNLGKTVAQLSLQQKNEISHRADAISQLKPLLADILKTALSG
ncbi:MAG: RdgB/HAM1 family non-canonical purine NTP pyrophosphatase [Planctomycetota bacterium]